jgi:hypothetical protein
MKKDPMMERMPAIGGVCPGACAIMAILENGKLIALAENAQYLGMPKAEIRKTEVEETKPGDVLSCRT